MIETFALSRRYGRFWAVQEMDLKVADGEVFGFLGLNGAGKTTVMRMMCGLLRPTSGYARIGDVDVHGPQDTNRLIPNLSFVSQEMRFFEQSTLNDLLHVYASLAGVSVDYGMKFAQQVGVPLDRPVGRFSPGQQRKAQLAIALLKQPRYLLLDEPTAGLDPQGVAEVRDIIRLLHATGTTVFLSSHILGEVQAICSSVGILHNGHLSYQGAIEEAYTIQVIDKSETAVAILQDIGIPAYSVSGGVRVVVPQIDLPAIIERLAKEVRIGIVQPADLEELFHQTVGYPREVNP